MSAVFCIASYCTCHSRPHNHRVSIIAAIQYLHNLIYDTQTSCYVSLPLWQLTDTPCSPSTLHHDDVHTILLEAPYAVLYSVKLRRLLSVHAAAHVHDYVYILLLIP